MLKYINFINESNDNNQDEWYIGNGVFDELDFTNWICKKIKNKYGLYTFSIKYSPLLYDDSNYQNCWTSPIERFKEVEQLKFSSCKNASDRLKNVFNIECISDDYVDYLDFSNKKIDYISFLPKNKINLVKNPNLDPYNNKYRQEMKFGRFFYKNTILDVKKLKKPIEILTNVYKSINQSIIKDTNIEIVEGEDIRYWYDEAHYEKGNSNLQKSCMRHSDCAKRFDIYVENPQVCKMLIIKNGNELSGRALLWKTNKGLFMDRIYTSNDHYYYMFLGYADKNKYMTKYNYKGDLYIQLNKSYDEPLPYMDTFKYYEYNENRLYNNRPKSYDYLLLNDF